MKRAFPVIKVPLMLMTCILAAKTKKMRGSLYVRPKRVGINPHPYMKWF